MLYKNSGKVYLKVSQKFVEVDVKKDKNNNYNVIPKNKKIEVYGNEDDFSEITLKEAYDVMNKSNKILSLDDEKLEK
jgi:hypothetical protein